MSNGLGKDTVPTHHQPNHDAERINFSAGMFYAQSWKGTCSAWLGVVKGMQNGNNGKGTCFKQIGWPQWKRSAGVGKVEWKSNKQENNNPRKVNVHTHMNKSNNQPTVLNETSRCCHCCCQVCAVCVWKGWGSCMSHLKQRGELLCLPPPLLAGKVPSLALFFYVCA